MSLLWCTFCSVVICNVTVVGYLLFCGHLRCHCCGEPFVVWSFAMSLLWGTFCSAVICDVTVVVYLLFVIICGVTVVVYLLFYGHLRCHCCGVHLRCHCCGVRFAMHLLRRHRSGAPFATSLMWYTFCDVPLCDATC